MSTTSSDNNASEKRYQLLVRLIATGVQKSRKSLNVPQLVRETYGEDASVYGGSDMLEEILEGMLDKIDDQAKLNTIEYLKENLIEEQLERIEGIIEKLQRDEMHKQKREVADYSSAHQALDATLLPTNVTLADILMHTAYHRQLKQKEEMESALNEIEQEISYLGQTHHEIREKVKGQAEKLKDAAKYLEQSADICSMIASA
jgi:predicted transcriptional regulator